LRTPDHTRPTISAQAVGIVQGVLDSAIRYVLADMAMKVEAARQLVYLAAARAERGQPDLGVRPSAASAATLPREGLDGQACG
jgi:alkylation response protein AidB-like acyl-CoA dehydrogenase